jgi:hypothetical protein
MTEKSQLANQDGRKRPRKRKPKQDKLANRTRSVGVRLSPDEYAQLLAEAVAAGKKKAELLRDSWLKIATGVRPVVQPARVMNEQDKMLYREWVGIANNLNQLTKISHLSYVVQAKIEEALTQLEPALANFRQQGGWSEVEQSEDDYTDYFTL